MGTDIGNCIQLAFGVADQNHGAVDFSRPLGTFGKCSSFAEARKFLGQCPIPFGFVNRRTNYLNSAVSGISR